MIMNRKLLLTLSIIAVLITTASAATLISRELKQSQYGSLGDILGVGDRIYKNTYNDGAVEYEYAKGLTLKPAFITSLQTTVSTDKFVDIPITLRGVSCMFGNAVNTHTLKSTNYDGGNYLGEQDYNVACNADYTGIFTIQITGRPTSIKVQEYILLKGTYVRGDSKIITVTYPGSTPVPTPYYPTPLPPEPLYTHTPIQTTTPLQYQCSNGDWVSSPSLCPVVTPTTPVPTETSTMILSTPVPTQTTTIQYQCSNGEFVYDLDDCPHSTLGFEAIFAIVGLFITAGLILRHREK